MEKNLPAVSAMGSGLRLLSLGSDIVVGRLLAGADACCRSQVKKLPVVAAVTTTILDFARHFQKASEADIKNKRLS